MAEKTNVPEIRFAGFTDPWEQRKLGEIAPVTMGQSPNGACYTDNPNDVVLVQGNADLKDGWVSPRVWTTEITKTAKSGDLIMSVRAPVGAMGKTAYDVVLGRGVAGIVGNEFLFQALSKKEAEGYWSTVSAGSTFDSINGDELRSTPIDCPRSETECEAIGNCLSKVDYLITLHQRKYDKLCAVKKSMLDKMFPKPGETEPEIRFAGFTDPWEQRKLGELFTESNERSSSEEILSVSVANGIYPASESGRDTNPGASIANYKVVRVGDIVYNSMRMWQGAVDSSKYNGIVSPAYVVARPAVELDSICFSYLLKRTDMLYKYLCDSQGNSKDTQTLRYDRFAEIVAKVPPTIDEQRAIADCLKCLDILITLHQRELNLLKNTKKSLLDKMFV